MMGIRCFISVELPDSLKREIMSRTDKLRAVDADAKWVGADNLHLTLKFLGDTPEDVLPAIKEALTRATGSHGKFGLDFSGVGVFPDQRRPRVVWVGVRDSDAIITLQRDIEDAMKEFGFEAEDREFSPHLTLGRVKSPKGRDSLIRELDALKDASFGRVEVSEVSFMKSELRPTGAKYAVLFAIPLGG